VICKRVKADKTFVKGDNMDENLLNGVIGVKNMKLRGQNCNLL
jgi:hypothetical protein